MIECIVKESESRKNTESSNEIKEMPDKEKNNEMKLCSTNSNIWNQNAYVPLRDASSR